MAHEDPFQNYPAGYDASSSRLIVVTPNDTNHITRGVKGLRIWNPTTTPAVVRVSLIDEPDVSFDLTVPASSVWIEPLRLAKVYATGTTAGLTLHGYSD